MSGNIIRVAILGDAKSLEKAAGESTLALGKIDKAGQSTGEKMASAGKKIAAGAATIAIAVGALSIKNADSLNESTDQLRNALKKQGESVTDLARKTAPAQKKLEEYGFTNAQVNDSVTQLTRGGFKLNEALKDQTIVADVAKAKHIDLAAASLLVTKAHQGQSRALKTLGLDANIANGSAKAQATALAGVAKASDALKLVEEKMHDGRLKGKAALDAHRAALQKVAEAQQKLTDSQHGGAAVLDLLSHKLGGTAAESAKSLHGKMEALHAKFTDFTAHLGQKLIPILLAVFNWFGKHTWAIGILAGLIGGAMLAATIAWTVSLFTAGGALAFLLSPVTLIVAGVALLAAGVIYAYNHFRIFRTIVDAAWSILQAVFGWIAQHWPLLLAILTGPIGLAVYFIAGHFQQIKDFATGLASWVLGRVGDIVNFFAGLPGAIGRVLSGVWSAITSPFREAWNWIANKWNAVQLPKIHIPGTSIDIGGGGLPHLPTFHSGGVFNSGRGEGIARLRDGEGIFTPEQMQALGSVGARHIVINLPAGVRGEDVVQAQRRYDRRNGGGG